MHRDMGYMRCRQACRCRCHTSCCIHSCCPSDMTSSALSEAVARRQHPLSGESCTARRMASGVDSAWTHNSSADMPTCMKLGKAGPGGWGGCCASGAAAARDFRASHTASESTVASASSACQEVAHAIPAPGALYDSTGQRPAPPGTCCHLTAGCPHACFASCTCARHQLPHSLYMRAGRPPPRRHRVSPAGSRHACMPPCARRRRWQRSAGHPLPLRPRRWPRCCAAPPAAAAAPRPVQDAARQAPARVTFGQNTRSCDERLTGVFSGVRCACRTLLLPRTATGDIKGSQWH